MAEKKGRKGIFIVLAAFIAYFFLGAKVIPRELLFAPVWAESIVTDTSSEDKVPPSSDRVLSFRLGDRFGFYSESGAVLRSDIVAYDVALSDSVWSNYQAVPDEIVFRSFAGDKLFAIGRADYPYMIGDRYYSVDTARSGLIEYERNGTEKWSRQFPSIITCMDAKAGMTLVGLLDGTILLVGREGREEFRFLPGGSSVEVILGCALSENGRYIAIVSGVGDERFLLLEKKADGYKVVYHRYVEGEFRREVKVGFLGDGCRIVFEQEGKLCIVTIQGGTMEYVPFGGRLASVQSSPNNELFFVMSEIGSRKRLTALSDPDSVLCETGFDSETSYITLRNNSLFLGKDGWILRIDVLVG